MSVKNFRILLVIFVIGSLKHCRTTKLPTLSEPVSLSESNPPPRRLCPKRLKGVFESSDGFGDFELLLRPPFTIRFFSPLGGVLLFQTSLASWFPPDTPFSLFCDIWQRSQTSLEVTREGTRLRVEQTAEGDIWFYQKKVFGLFWKTIWSFERRFRREWHTPWIESLHHTSMGWTLYPQDWID